MAEADLNKLLQKSGQGDSQAFRQLSDIASPKLMAIAVRMLNDHNLAEDVVQQTMMTAWHSAADYDPGRSQAATWHTSITRYRALDLIRKRGRQREILRDEQQDILSVLGHDEPVRDNDPVPSETADRLRHCFGEIRRDQAGCIQLTFVDGLTFNEIAMKLDRSLGTVKSWMRRGLQKLRECVEL